MNNFKKERLVTLAKRHARNDYLGLAGNYKARRAAWNRMPRKSRAQAVYDVLQAIKEVAENGK